MLIAYLTHDDVNRDFAARLAAGVGVELEPLTLRDKPGRFDAVLYDVDFLPADERGRLLAELSSQRADRPTAVHGYGLSARERRALRRRGVIVARRLCGALFARLRRPAGGVPAARPKFETELRGGGGVLSMRFPRRSAPCSHP
jgi:hypothetical protein